jgi:3-phenylpropionate/cinnamic acid dioxygenase small subunit
VTAEAAFLADRLAINDLLVRYAWAIDTKDWDALDDVFTADVTAELASPLLSGREAIASRIKLALEPLDDSQHMVTNHQVTIAPDGNSATCRCYLQAQHVRRVPDGGHNFIIGGRYEDTVVRTPQGWRIDFRRLVVMWREGNPEVLHRST